MLCHSNIHCSCSLVCLALSQHHAALALSCALLCLSITLLLLSHVPCFVSASRCSCSLMCLALSQHHAALAPCFVSTSRCSCSLMCLALSQHHAAQPEHHAALILMCLALSKYCILICFVSTSLLPFLLFHVHCFVHHVVSGYHAALALSCALLCLAQHHTALSSASPQHHSAHVPCLVSA